ncbi:Stage V sporulation protein K [Monoraphidium neglectum]|uniref:Stage V sporulation protein K n=1 Tax=Monoraphidium neglectum TaxID=145388 RepID=A0A0D2J4T0_9CHLO|nr:Stage V sporulation protein K [Monoraphidium neglectum]KIY94942.1 Stage V sporulation protein K [Monoraphidium neglectum]|eukprot:XP_013893962.1 Stage V sporulation protein K [Monoraphidium neglectum]
MKLTGLAAVKERMLQLRDEVELDKERGRPPNSRNANIRFYGNPGTGKTTVARLYAQLLSELGVLPTPKPPPPPQPPKQQLYVGYPYAPPPPQPAPPKAPPKDGPAVVETSGAKLTKADLQKALDGDLAEGGVLFIDEAYQLNPKTNPLGGREVLDLLLTEAENRRGKLVVVLAGYRTPMEELMAYNEGLPSRFPAVFTFEDNSDEELCEIFMGMMAADKSGFKLEDERWARIATRRLGRQRDAGGAGFGNARAVRNLYEQSIARQSARVLAERREGGAPDPLLLRRDDLLGPKRLDAGGSKALQELEAMRGLRRVKESVQTLLGLIETNADLEEQERPLKEVCLNRVFLGNPGTGKTTVASIYGRVLRDLGLLSKGEVLVKVPADFVGSALGESEKKTAAILEEARGCVLVIDEAYGLHTTAGSKDPYRVAVIDTLVAKVQGVPGDDRCVLLLGYREQMEEMMRDANPGLARRFQMQNAWEFDDYSSEDLFFIMRAAAKKRYGWDLGHNELKAGLAALEVERRRPNFGNAGAVNNLLAAAALRMEARTKSLPPAARADATPVPADFGEEHEGASDPGALLDDLVGCAAVRTKVRQ